jgi:pimeloyl-ACP methyl ester carboxylesterase
MLPALPYKILVPDLDRTAPLALAERAAKFVSPGGTYRVERIKNCGHWVLIEYPEIASQSIMNWLEQDVLPKQATLLERIQSKL